MTENCKSAPHGLTPTFLPVPLNTSGHLIYFVPVYVCICLPHIGSVKAGVLSILL